MSVDNLQERLAAMSALFDDVEPASGSLFEPPPPGDYEGLVYEFAFFEGGTPKQAFVKVVIDTQHDLNGNTQFAGRRAEIVNSLEDPERLPFLKALFDTLVGDDGGVSVLGRRYSITDVVPESPLLVALLDVPVRFRAVESKKVNQETGRPYLNIYLNERLGAAVRQGAVDPARAGNASDVDNDTSGFDASVPPSAGAAVVEGAPLPKADGCICPAPEQGRFLETCQVPGHGIPF